MALVPRHPCGKRTSALPKGQHNMGRKARPLPLTFLMTPKQCLAQAQSLRATGNETLARPFEIKYRLRTGEWPPSPSIAPEV